jgi:hypothetical protein
MPADATLPRRLKTYSPHLLTTATTKPSAWGGFVRNTHH